MRYRELGATGIHVSEIGYGTWGIGGTKGGATAYGPTSDTESLAALRAAYYQGVTLYDTSDLYGFGHAEDLLGEAFSDDSPDVIIATKGGFIDFAGQQDFSAAYLTRALEASLQRLRRETVDLYLLHTPQPENLNDDVVRTLEGFKRSGKVRATGLSASSPQEALAALRYPAIEFVQVNFNILDQRAIDCGLFDKCRERRVGVVGRTPLCFGFLTGAFSAEDVFPEGDHRSRWTIAQREAWIASAQAFIGKFAAERGQTMAQFALQFCLSFDAVSSVIPGMLNMSHVQENTLSSDLGPLPAEVVRHLRSDYQEAEANRGRPQAAAVTSS